MGAGGRVHHAVDPVDATNIFRDPAERAKAIGIWAGVSGVGIVLGPGHRRLAARALLVGLGVPGQRADRRSSPSSPAAASCPNRATRRAAALDPSAPSCPSSGWPRLVWAIIEAPGEGLDRHGPCSTAFALAAVLLAAFVGWELPQRRADARPARSSRNPRFSAAAVPVTLAFFALFGSVFFLTQYLQFVLGYAPLETGVRVMPVADARWSARRSPLELSRRLGDKAGRRRRPGAGRRRPGCCSRRVDVRPGTASSRRAGHPRARAWASPWRPRPTRSWARCRAAKAGVGSAMNDTTRQVGGALGVAVLGSVLSSGYTAHLGTAATPVPDQARDGIGAAMRIADQLPGAAGAALSDAARTAFLHGMGLASLVAAGGRRRRGAGRPAVAARARSGTGRASRAAGARRATGRSHARSGLSRLTPDIAARG